MSNPTPLSVNCYPQCSSSKLVSAIQALNPCIDIVRLHTSMLTQENNSNVKLEELITKIQDAKTDQKNKDTTPQSNFNISEYLASDINNVKAFSTIFGFFSLMSASTDLEYKDIPIHNSPQIRINNNSGFTKEQSIFEFVRSLTSTGAFGALFESLGLSAKAKGIITSAENFAGLFGFSPRVAPYFSLAENPFSDKPSLTIEIKLINDSKISADNNNTFLNYCIKDALVGRHTIDGGMFSRWWPPKLFNVGLKFGTGNHEYVKRYHLCTLSASVTPEGLMRKSGSDRIPDAYSVNMTFTSLLPDTIDTWIGKFNPSSYQTTGELYKEFVKINRENYIKDPEMETGTKKRGQRDSGARATKRALQEKNEIGISHSGNGNPRARRRRGG